VIVKKCSMWLGLDYYTASGKIPAIKLDVRRCAVELGLDSSGSGKIQVTVIYERSNVPSGTIKYGEFRDWLNEALSCFTNTFLHCIVRTNWSLDIAVLYLLFKLLWLLHIPPGIILKKICVLPTQCIDVLCGSRNKQLLFPYATLTDWFL